MENKNWEIYLVLVVWSTWFVLFGLSVTDNRIVYAIGPSWIITSVFVMLFLFSNWMKGVKSLNKKESIG